MSNDVFNSNISQIINPELLDIRSLSNRRLILTESIRLLKLIFESVPFTSPSNISYKVSDMIDYILLDDHEKDMEWVFFDSLKEFVTCDDFLEMKMCYLCKKRSSPEYIYSVKENFVICMISIPSITNKLCRSNLYDELCVYLSMVCKSLNQIIAKKNLLGKFDVMGCRDEIEIQINIEYPITKKEYTYMVKRRNRV